MNIVKESLAKLLATENLIVEHRPVETAQFEVISRVLTLPTWEHECNDCLLYTSPSPRDMRRSRMPSSA